MLAPFAADRIDSLPRDEHRQHGGLARAGRKLQREPVKLRVCVAVRALEVLEEAPELPHMGGDLGEPDRRLHGFDLAEERPQRLELVAPPILQQPRRFGRDLPLRGRQRPPGCHGAPHLVDERPVVLLLLRREALALVEDDFFLLDRSLVLLGLRDRRDELSAATLLDDLLRGLAVLVKLPVPCRDRVGGIQDGMVEERVGNSNTPALSWFGWARRLLRLRGPAALAFRHPCLSPSTATCRSPAKVWRGVHESAQHILEKRGAMQAFSWRGA
jgi:hypothetical protein